MAFTFYKNMDTSNWPFDQGPNVAAITSRFVLDEGRPILQVTHYEDDHSWAFLSGDVIETSDAKVVGMKEIMKIDPTVAEVANLAPGWSATRERVGGEWREEKDEWEDE